MPFFRRTPVPTELSYRPLVASDIPIILGLIEQTTWAALAMPHEELALVLEDNLSIVAEQAGKLWAVVVVSWAGSPAAWIRALVLHQNLRPADSVPTLLSVLENHLRQRGVQHLYMMSDDRDSTWLRPVLLNNGYKVQVEVIGYEKRTMAVPQQGNLKVGVRPATPADVQVIAAVDAAAFTPEWVKNAGILAGVFPIAPCYLVAELDGHIIGYAFATTHHEGAVAHLVRIAVLPTHQHQALGVRLLVEVVEWCKHNGVQLLSLNTQASNRHAQKLYEWFGFVRNGEQQTVLTKRTHCAASTQGELNLVPG